MEKRDKQNRTLMADDTASICAKDLKKMLSFEEKLQKFEKYTLSVFIILLLDKQEYNKALDILRGLEEISSQVH